MIARVCKIVGILLATAGVLIFALTFYPIVREEIRYAQRQTQSTKKSPPITPVDSEFGIVIPKLGANAHIIANIDPNNPRQYQQALTRGVAHARGTVFPGSTGNVFLFAHSAEDFFIANQYNAIFYLLGKLSTGDEIDLYYKQNKYIYRVISSTIAQAKDVTSLTHQTAQKTLTLMTCWPPGTTLSRLIVHAQIVSQ